MLEEELKKIYRFFVQQERELYLQINTRLHIRAKYDTFSLVQLEKELDELQTLSSYATSLSCYIYLNMTGMSKILKKFDKKFKRYNLNFTKNFIVEKYQKKNSDLLYIHQYKILDEVGACVEQLKNELLEKYNYLVKNPIKEVNNARLAALNQKIKSEQDGKQDPLINNNIINTEEVEANNNNNEEFGEIDKIRNKFAALNNSISNMEAFYHSISLVFEVWMRYIKANEYKSHIYSVRSAREIYETTGLNNNNEEKNEGEVKKPEHFLSKESYWNIRIILVQAFIMSICSTFCYPTIYYLLKSDEFSDNGDDERKEKRGMYCGLIISMNPIGSLISLIYSKYMVNKSYKIPLISSSILSTIGNLIFIFGIYHSSIFLMCFGSLITGFSLNTSVHRQYLLYFIPKRKINKYLLYFKLVVLLGNAAGPLLSLCSLIIFPDRYLYDSDNRVFNEFTFPAWACMLSSMGLLTTIILIFSEPLDPRFVVYAEGQDPTETMKRADSFTLDDSMTIFESEKLNEINQKVSSFNDENQFDDTNLVSSTINQLIDVELEPHGRVRKAFWVIMVYIFVLNFIIMSFITMAPSFLYVNSYRKDYGLKPKGQKIVSILMFFSLFLFIPAFCINFFYISLRINKILYIKLLSLMLLTLELLTTIFVIQSDLPGLYYFCFLFTILFSYMMEDQIFYFYTQIIPSNFELLNIKGLTGLNIMRYLGDISGSLTSLFGIAIYEDVTERNIEKDNFSNNYEEILMTIQNCFSILALTGLVLIFFKFSDHFADRPIRRLVYSKNIREIRRTEF